MFVAPTATNMGQRLDNGEKVLKIGSFLQCPTFQQQFLFVRRIRIVT